VHGSWPTPSASLFGVADTVRLLERREKYAEKYGNNGFGLTLGQEIAFWPTPTVQDGKNNGGPSQMERNTLPLNAEVCRFPTPSHPEETTSELGLLLQEWTPPSCPQLNVPFVEWLMGYPVGWTDGIE
jgi:hypothetical protein